MHQPRIYCDELWLICQRAWVNIISFTVSSGADKSLFSSTWKPHRIYTAHDHRRHYEFEHIFRCHTRLFCVAARCTPHICGVVLFPQIFAHVCSSSSSSIPSCSANTHKEEETTWLNFFVSTAVQRVSAPLNHTTFSSGLGAAFGKSPSMEWLCLC